MVRGGRAAERRVTAGAGQGLRPRYRVGALPWKTARVAEANKAAEGRVRTSRASGSTPNAAPTERSTHRMQHTDSSAGRERDENHA
ncbi:hypothetical protein GCM10027073_20820 [Streptomyces chlorus]